jgi:hypothetical protein
LVAQQLLFHGESLHPKRERDVAVAVKESEGSVHLDRK